MARKGQAGADLVRVRWARTTAAERSEVARELNRRKWEAMTAEERSAEMGRRRRLGLSRARKARR